MRIKTESVLPFDSLVQYFLKMARTNLPKAVAAYNTVTYRIYELEKRQFRVFNPVIAYDDFRFALQRKRYPKNLRIPAIDPLI